MSARNIPPADQAPRRRAPGARRRRGRLLALAVALALVAIALASTLAALAADHDSLSSAVAVKARTPGKTAVRARRGARPRPTTARTHAPTAASTRPVRAETVVSIAPEGGAVRVPPSFLGISTEYPELPLFERQMPLFERALSLLRVPGGGPLLLRVGGDSADHSFWAPKARPVPVWQFELTPVWLQQTSTLVRALGLRLLLDLNLVTDSPPIAAQWAQAAETQLPRGSIAAFEIGNEPDIYNRLYWLATVSRSKLGAGVPPLGLTASSYARDFQAYAHALERAAPRVPLVGPALANPLLNLSWVSRLLAGHRSPPGEISVHRYPYSACALPGTPGYATVARVLSEKASAGVAQTVRPAVALARRAGIPLRVTELNSVTCGGRRGVSDTFATALWAPDALFELLRAGAVGVDVHVRARAINAAFSTDHHGLIANPLFYGLILFTRTLAPNSQLVPLHVRADRSLHVKMWAVRAPGGSLNVLLIDKGQRAMSVGLRLPGAGSATVQRLVAPSAWSRSGITLAGQWLGRDGTWHGRLQHPTVRQGAHGYELTVPRFSAALVTVHLRAGAGAGAFTFAPVRAPGRRVYTAKRSPVRAEPSRRRARASVRSG